MRPAAHTRFLRTRRFGAQSRAPLPSPTAAPLGDPVGAWRLAGHVSVGQFVSLHRARPLAADDSAADYLIKIASSGAATDFSTALLAREKAVAQSLVQPHVISVLGGQLVHQQPHLVLAAAGMPINRWPGEPLPLRIALWRARQIAAALAALHAAGWIHSRLTPEALLISERGQVTLHELGWSRRIGTDECRADHLLAADLLYVAPEMLCDATVLAPAADVYGLGILLIEMLTGHSAVTASAPYQAALAHLRSELGDVRILRPELPPSLPRLIRRMTAREPLRRPSADEVQRELVRMEISSFRGVPSDRRKE